MWERGERKERDWERDREKAVNRVSEQGLVPLDVAALTHNSPLLHVLTKAGARHNPARELCFDDARARPARAAGSRRSVCRSVPGGRVGAQAGGSGGAGRDEGGGDEEGRDGLRRPETPPPVEPPAAAVPPHEGQLPPHRYGERPDPQRNMPGHHPSANAWSPSSVHGRTRLL